MNSRDPHARSRPSGLNPSIRRSDGVAQRIDALVSRPHRRIVGCPLLACTVTRRRFPVGASPTRQPLQPEAIGAVMEVTKIYKLNWCSEWSKRPRIAKFSQLIPDNREIYAESGSQQTASTTKRKSLQRSYNEQRPHSALGYLTPAAYAANLTATCDRLRNPEQLRRSHVAPPMTPSTEISPSKAPCPRKRTSRLSGIRSLGANSFS